MAQTPDDMIAGLPVDQQREVETEAARLKLKAMRRRFQTAQLSDEVVEQIDSARMDPRHNHLNTLIDPKQRD